ncbi:unnamed protein product [Mytilus edulis]|uniref:Uncharacterized protein n=1 Tax=Mytilus edulis TaxID=6550 RepID=A0A8S3TPA5_MYTED|nr:unnamed protein product [Mytilus edulis]
MAYRLYASSESLEVVDSPTLSTRSLPGVYKKRYLQLSDEDSLCSSYECLNDITVSGNRRLRQISTSDSQDLSDMSPMSASGDSPRLPNTSVNYGKKRRAPLPPVHVSIKEPEHSKRQTQDDFYLERRLSRIEEDIEKRRRPISSYDAPLINVHSPEDISPRLSSSQRFRMKAAMILSLHSPKLNRRDTQGSKRKGKKKLLNQSFEELDPEDVVFCYLSPDLHEEYDFEVGSTILSMSFQDTWFVLLTIC